MHFAEFLGVRITSNIGGFQFVEPVEPPPPDYTKLYQDHKVEFGMHKGKTFRQLIKDNAEYCRWILDQDSKPKNFKGTPLHTYLNARWKK
jgi:hypothetical protein